jgi:2-hydroxychromene-2-carboxylate isomerase
MKHIVFHIDFISPYAYLAFEQLPQALEGITHSVEYRPLLFAGLLDANGQLGPAEIAPKREWTYRQVLWQAHQQGIEMAMPAAHPFNPLALLRLALACGQDGAVNRHVCETIFRQVWRGGADATDAARLDALKQQLFKDKPDALDPAGDEVKGLLRRQTDAAVRQGIFGVPTAVVDGRHFWGFDALPMLRACLQGDPWFEGPAWEAARHIPTGIARARPPRS